MADPDPPDDDLDQFLPEDEWKGAFAEADPKKIRLISDNPHPRRRKLKTQDAPTTEQMVMRAFVERNEKQLRYNHDIKRWFIWSAHRWHEDRKQRVVEMVLAFCRELGDSATLQKIRFAKNVEEAARTQIEVATDNKDWDADPWMLGTPGGVIDLISGNLRPGLPEDMISKTVAVTPAERANCPRWVRFLDEALDHNPETIAYFQRFCGYSLTGVTREEALLYIAGKPGTGKGTACRTILALMRDYAMPVPVSMFTDAGWRAQEYYRAQLLGKRMIMAAEPEKGAKWSDAFVNEITGGDRITGRHPTGQPFAIDPEFKLVIQGEQVPELKSVATGLRRRLGILPFEVQPAEPDPNLKEILRSEYPGVLRWMIDGCRQWQARRLDPPAEVKNAVDAYFALQDRMARWIDDCCDRWPAARVKPSELRASFNAWADRNGEERMSFSEFHQALHREFKQTTVTGKPYVHGLMIKPQVADADPDHPWREF